MAFTAEYLAALRELARRNGLAPELIAPPDREGALDHAHFRMWFDEWSVSRQPTVVFLHGSGQTARIWDLVCTHLAGGYRCVALDLPGHGRSDWSAPENYSIPRTAEAVAWLLAVLAINSATVVGLSRGGLVGLRLAALRPELVQALAVLDIAPSVLVRPAEPAPGPPSAVDLGAMLSTRVVLPTVDDFVELSLARNPRRDPHLLRTTIRHSLRQLPGGEWTWHWDPAMFAGDGRQLREVSALLEADARALASPLLVVRGEHSPMLTPEAAADLAALAPNGEWATVPAAGHSIPGDNAAGLLAVLTPWLAAVGGAAR